jgi:hypothetical protein
LVASPTAPCPPSKTLGGIFLMPYYFTSMGFCCPMVATIALNPLDAPAPISVASEGMLQGSLKGLCGCPYVTRFRVQAAFRSASGGVGLQKDDLQECPEYFLELVQGHRPPHFVNTAFEILERCCALCDGDRRISFWDKPINAANLDSGYPRLIP